MIDFTQYKQDIWKEYTDLNNRFAQLNDSGSVNCRLIHLNTDRSVWDNVGGSLQNWSSILTQLQWDVYENVPLFANVPSTTSEGPLVKEAIQSFTATLKFKGVEPLPNDMLTYYDDPSGTVYHIKQVRFHKTVQHSINIFEIDLETTPLNQETFYNDLAIENHYYYDQYNTKLFDFWYFNSKLRPVLENVKEIVREVNGFFDNKKEVYTDYTLNTLVSDLLKCSKYGALTKLRIPFGDYSDTQNVLDPNSEIYSNLEKLKEILCLQ